MTVNAVTQEEPETVDLVDPMVLQRMLINLWNG